VANRSRLASGSVGRLGSRIRTRQKALCHSPLERLHLCCKDSCEFVESSHRTVLLRNPHRRSILILENRRAGRFLILKEQKTDPPPVLKIFRTRNAHLCRRGQIRRPGNGDFDRSPPALHPPFMGAPGGGQGRVLSLCFLRFFIGRFVSSWARDGNRPAANAPSCLAVQRHTSLNRVGLNSV